MHPISRIAPALTCVAVLSATVLAGDLTPPAGPIAPTPGPEPRIPINAVNTPGDPTSVFSITAPGSYYLTGNVTGAAGKNGIKIVSNGVSIDLMGYELRGVAGSLDGIRVSSPAFYSIEVRNGSVRGWDGDGIDLSSALVRGARVDSIRSILNDGNGIAVASTTTVSQCCAVGNLGNGIDTGTSCTIVECQVNTSGQSGIRAGAASSVTSSAVTYSGAVGIYAANGCTVSQCSSQNNGDIGIRISSGTVTSCASSFNGADGIFGVGGATITGCSASSNNGDGIEVAADALVVGNSCDSNVMVSPGFAAGIHATSTDARIEGNNCTDNHYGVLIDAGGNIVIRNTCAGNFTANWQIAVGNAVGSIVLAGTNGGIISGDTYAGSLGSTDPNANFSY